MKQSLFHFNYGRKTACFTDGTTIINHCGLSPLFPNIGALQNCYYQTQIVKKVAPMKQSSTSWHAVCPALQSTLARNLTRSKFITNLIDFIRHTDATKGWTKW